MAELEYASKSRRDFECGILHGWAGFISGQQRSSVAQRGFVLRRRDRSGIAGSRGESGGAVVAHLGWIGQAHYAGVPKGRDRCFECAAEGLCECRILPRRPWILL